MEETFKLCLLGIIILLAHLMEGITGFGSTVIILPFVAILLGIKVTVPLLCVLSWTMALYILARSWRHIQWREFLFIALCTGCGLPIGMFLFEKMSPVGLCLLLSLFMIGVGINGAIKTRKSSNASPMPAKASKNWLMRLVLFCGGIIHGAFGTGGPFVVIYAAKALPEKSLFRVTLSLLWFFLSTWRLIFWAIKGNVLNAELGHLLLCVLPFMIVGVLIGDYLHHRVSEYWFRLIVYAVLSAAGCVMLINNLLKLF